MWTDEGQTVQKWPQNHRSSSFQSQVCKTLKTSSATRTSLGVQNKKRFSRPKIYRNWTSNSQWKVEVGSWRPMSQTFKWLGLTTKYFSSATGHRCRAEYEFYLRRSHGQMWRRQFYIQRAALVWTDLKSSANSNSMAFPAYLTSRLFHLDCLLTIYFILVQNEQVIN